MIERVTKVYKNVSTCKFVISSNRTSHEHQSNMDRVNGGMKRSSSENATNATRDPETIFSNVVPGQAGAGPENLMSQSKPWKQRFSFRQPRKQPTLEEVGDKF